MVGPLATYSDRWIGFIWSCYNPLGQDVSTTSTWGLHVWSLMLIPYIYMHIYRSVGHTRWVLFDGFPFFGVYQAYNKELFNLLKCFLTGELSNFCGWQGCSLQRPNTLTIFQCWVSSAIDGQGLMEYDGQGPHIPSPTRHLTIYIFLRKTSNKKVAVIA